MDRDQFVKDLIDAWENSPVVHEHKGVEHRAVSITREELDWLVEVVQGNA